MTEDEITALVDPVLMQGIIKDEHTLRSQLLSDSKYSEVVQTVDPGLTPVGMAVSSDAVSANGINGSIERRSSPQRKKNGSMSPRKTPAVEAQQTTGGIDGPTTNSVANAPDNRQLPREANRGGVHGDTEQTSLSEHPHKTSHSPHRRTESKSSAGRTGSVDHIELDDRSNTRSDGYGQETLLDDEIDTCVVCEQIVRDTSSGTTTCAICRHHTHNSCVDEKDTSTDGWTCSNCLKNKASTSPHDTMGRSRSSAPRLVRDLLPVSRGLQKPGAHSIFAQPLIGDVEDGNRALRRRRSPTNEPAPGLNKRHKPLAMVPKQDALEDGPAFAHSLRRSAQKLTTVSSQPTARVLQHRPFHKPPPHKFILAFRLPQDKIADILSEPPRPHRRRDRRKRQKIPPPLPYQPPVPKFPALPTNHLIFPTMFGDRETEANTKPYGGILSEIEADTSRSLPQTRDREAFESARKEAEEERRKASAAADAYISGTTTDAAGNPTSKKTVSGPPSKIKCIQFGKYCIDTSYAAPYPEEYSHESRLFICEFCLKYLPSEFVAYRHKLKCPAKHPPGDEIYRDESLSIWEVDGRKKTEYCQCLCLMAKLFLGSKTLYYDVDPFLFYILTEYDEYGYHFVGYFSKEKRPASQNNVSCILVMPIHQRKGYATFLIEFSYLLTRIEGKEGSPEKPLSDMGLTAYRSYWDLTISRHLLELEQQAFSIKLIMDRTGMTADDVVHSLERLYAFVKDPVTKTYGIRFDKNLYKNIVNKYEAKEFRRIRPERLVWTPYVMGRSDTATLDAAPVATIAQRDNEYFSNGNAEDTTDTVSPKTSMKPCADSSTEVNGKIEVETDLDPNLDPALFNDLGRIAPGPPPTDIAEAAQAAAVEEQEAPSVHVDGNDATTWTEASKDKRKSPAFSTLTGYALAYAVYHIPPTRFEIDPPIPAAMLRNKPTRKRSIPGISTQAARSNGDFATPSAVRHSPRKARSTAGSMSTRSNSRNVSPEKPNGSVRRSGRTSRLAHEVEMSSIADESDAEGEDENEDTIMQDAPQTNGEDGDVKAKDDRRARNGFESTIIDDDEEEEAVSVTEENSSDEDDIAIESDGEEDEQSEISDLDDLDVEVNADDGVSDGESDDEDVDTAADESAEDEDGDGDDDDVGSEAVSAVASIAITDDDATGEDE